MRTVSTSFHASSQAPEGFFPVFQTDRGAVLQHDRHNRLRIEFGGRHCNLKFIHFFSLKKQAEQVDVRRLLFDLSQQADQIELSSCGLGGSIWLNLSELLALRELLQGARAMMELNSYLRQANIGLPSGEEQLA